MEYRKQLPNMENKLPNLEYEKSYRIWIWKKSYRIWNTKKRPNMDMEKKLPNMEDGNIDYRPTQMVTRVEEIPVSLLKVIGIYAEKKVKEKHTRRRISTKKNMLSHILCKLR